MAWRTFLFKSVVALRISSRLSPWRSRSFYFSGEAQTASVRRCNAIFPADTTFRDWRTSQHYIPADLDLDSLFVKDLRTLCSQLSLPTAGTRSAIDEQLKEAREAQRNAQPISAPPPIQNGGDNIELQQQFQQLQQEVQDLLNRNSYDERMLCESQLTQAKSLVLAASNETIEQTAAAAAQAAVNAFTGSSSSSQAVVPERNESSEGNVPLAVQEKLNSTAVVGVSGNDINSTSSASQQTLDSVHELPPKLVREILSGKFMKLSKLLPKNFNSLQPLHDEPLTLTLANSVITVNKAKATSITNTEEWTSIFTAYMKSQGKAPWGRG